MSEMFNGPTKAYYTGLNGVEIKGVEYGVDDYLYCVSGMLGGKKTRHRLRIRSNNAARSYVMLFGRRMFLDQCIRVVPVLH